MDKEPKWVSAAKSRLLNIKRIAVGSDLHLLEMALSEYERLHAELGEAQFLKADRVSSDKGYIDNLYLLTKQRDSEREERHKVESLLRQKDMAMQTLFDRLNAHGDKCEDLMS